MKQILLLLPLLFILVRCLDDEVVELTRLNDGLPSNYMILPNEADNITEFELPLALNIDNGKYATYVIKLKKGEDEKEFAATHGLEIMDSLPNMENWWIFKEQIFPLSYKEENSSIPEIDSWIDDQRVLEWNKVESFLLHKKITLNDPLFPGQWHLRNIGQNGGLPGNDIKVEGAWDSGVTGTGILVQVVDDGLDYTHPDFNGKYVSSASYDYLDDDNDPMTEETHGTACAGLAVADENNGVCGVGVAYNAQVSAIRLVGSGATTTDIARSFTQYTVSTNVAISTNSWGFEDSGVGYTKLPCVVEEARRTAATNGRGGKGVVIFFASGNGYQDGDSCSYDEISTSPYTITVAASNAAGGHSGYSERCAGVFVSAPSNDVAGSGYPAITTDTVDGECTSSFGGTSAATPIAAGVGALILQVNPKLSYRDVMYIFAKTSDVISRTADSDWVTNGGGYNHSYTFGFGRVNAPKAVNVAKTWVPVGTLDIYSRSVLLQRKTTTDVTVISNITIPTTGQVEHVNVYVDIEHNYPNELEVVLRSPYGTESVLTTPHNWGIVPVIQLVQSSNTQTWMGRYTSFSPKMTANAKISTKTIQFARTNSDCSNLYPLDSTTALSSSSVQGVIIVVPYDGSCDAGTLASVAQSKGAAVVWFYSNYRNITGETGSTIPSMFIPIGLGNLILDNSNDAGRLVGPAWNVVATKYVVDGGLENYFRFTTVRHWGESSQGTWQLKVRDRISGDNGTIRQWKLEIMGQLSTSTSTTVGSPSGACDSNVGSNDGVSVEDGDNNSSSVGLSVNLFLCLLTIVTYMIFI